MTTTVDVLFENGVLKPVQPIALAEGARVHLTLALDGEEESVPSKKPARSSWEKMLFGRSPSNVSVSDEVRRQRDQE